MSLKQSVVVVNEFTQPTPKGGTRGASPGKYVLRYMARDGAVENLAPVKRQDQETFVLRYMMRKSAVEKAVKRGMSPRHRDVDGADGMGGIAFGRFGRNDSGDVSLSDEKLKRLSRGIQAQFDKGKTVLKTVVSFDLSYLKKHGVVREDFTPRNRGDFRGNIDQMKMRKAIMAGMNRLAGRYDDLMYVGVVQVDTMHVHAHLCMVDKGKGRLAKDGTQKGMLTAKAKSYLRRGIDASLDEMGTIKYLSSSVQYDRRNARCYIKDFTHKAMRQNGFGQFLVACLPKNKNLWRAGTNRKEMRKANAIVREYVEEVLTQPDSGYEQALRSIGEYAHERTKREGLSDNEFRQLVDRGREKLITDCMNGVYSVLKELPEAELKIKTPMLDAMSRPIEEIMEIRKSDPMVEFSYRLRSYSSRLDKHRNERERMHEAVKSFSENSEPDNPALAFFKFEEEYQSMLMCKYQHFLAFIAERDKYKEKIKQLQERQDYIKRFYAMGQDEQLKELNEEAAEDYGLEKYGVRGGKVAKLTPLVHESRLNTMVEDYEREADELAFESASDGYRLIENDEGVVELEHSLPYTFDAVKALDIHHLTYDFTYDLEISKPNIDMFQNVSRVRSQLFENAKVYLEEKFDAKIEEDVEKDVEMMRQMSAELESGDGILPYKELRSKRFERTPTLTLDYPIHELIRDSVNGVVANIEQE